MYSFIFVTYRSVPGDVSVTIAGSSCTVSTATDTELECVTGPHAGSVVADVKVEVSGNGIAQEVSVFLLALLCQRHDGKCSLVSVFGF